MNLSASVENSGRHHKPDMVTNQHVMMRRTIGMKLFLSLQPIHMFALPFFFYPMRSETLFLSGAISIVVYSFLIHEEYLHDRFGVSPFLLYLFLSWIRIGIVPIYVAFAIVHGYHTDLLFAGHDASEHFIPGHFINVLGDWFFLAGYYIFRRYSSPLAPLQFRNPMTPPGLLAKSALLLFVITYGFRLGTWSGIPMESLGQPYVFFASYGIPSAIFVLIFILEQTDKKNRPPIVMLLAAVFLIELKLSLSSYMKQNVVLCVLPVFLYLAINFRKIAGPLRPRILYRRMILAGMVFVFFSSVLFTYSQLRRAEFWTRPGLLTKETPEIMPFLVSAVKASIPGTREFSDCQVFPNDGLWSFFGRNDFIRVCGWCYSYVELNGNSDGEFIRQVPRILIPRILWPNKPFVSVGRNIAVLLGQAKDWESATTATGFSMAGCLYWAWGYPSLLIGMFLNGMLLFLAWKIFSPSIIVNPISTLICITLFIHGIRWFEGAFDGNLVNYIIIFVCFFPLARFMQKGTLRFGAGISSAELNRK